MPNAGVESLIVHPIYDVHHTGQEMRQRVARLDKAIWAGVEPVEFSMWTDKAVLRVQEVKPRVLYPDSLPAGDFAWREILSYLPINPVHTRWDGRDSFVVAGDVVNNYDFNGESNISNAIHRRFIFRGKISPEEQDEMVIFRTGLGPTKTIEAALRLPEIDLSTDPLAALWGNGHALTITRSYDTDPLERRKGLIPTLFKTISETFQNYCKGVDSKLREEAFFNFPGDRLDLIQDILTRFIGSTTVWRIKEYDPRDLSSYEQGIVIEDRFISPTVAALVKEVSQAFFLQDPKERLEWIMTNVHRPNSRGAL
jgi:hypothetical protein